MDYFLCQICFQTHISLSWVLGMRLLLQVSRPVWKVWLGTAPHTHSLLLPLVPSGSWWDETKPSLPRAHSARATTSLPPCIMLMQSLGGQHQLWNGSSLLHSSLRTPHALFVLLLLFGGSVQNTQELLPIRGHSSSAWGIMPGMKPRPPAYKACIQNLWASSDSNPTFSEK